MLRAATIGVLLSLAPQAAPPAKTLWLVQPLYPGQELLVGRTEEVLRRLMSSSTDQAIGSQALADHLKGKTADLSCLVGDAACADPIDGFVASLGLERIVLIKGGQEDAAYRIKVTSYLPQTGEATFAEGVGPALDRALMAALVKVVPLASSIEIVSEPPGATVFIDGEKVGVTPYQGQVLPGERLVKLEIASHMPAEKKIEVPVRGQVKVSESLEKVPARIVLTAQPAGTSITIDGVKVGVDKIDKPIQPGRHQLSFDLEGYEPVREDADVAPGATFTADRTLIATGWTNVKAAMRAWQESIYKRGPSLTISYEWAELYGNKLYAQEDITKNPDKDLGYQVARQALKRNMLHGLSLEYNQDGRYFGLQVVGIGYYTGDDWTYTLENGAAVSQTGKPTMVLLRALQPHLRFALWRFVLYGQAGFEGRAFLLQPDPGQADNKMLWFLDVQVTGEAALRAYLVEGLYLEGMFRFSWAFQGHAAVRGFHVGLGYAF